MDRQQALARLRNSTVGMDEQHRREVEALVRELTPPPPKERKAEIEAMRHRIHRRKPWQPCWREGMPKFCTRCIWRQISGENRRNLEVILEAQEESIAVLRRRTKAQSETLE